MSRRAQPIFARLAALVAAGLLACGGASAAGAAPAPAAVSATIAVPPASAVAPARTADTRRDLLQALLAEVAHYEAGERRVARHIATFDALDFDVFSHQEWDRLQESHAPDIVVHWPDGRQTVGLDAHVADLKALFVFAPDTRIETHPVKFGDGEWTAVIGVMQGTFTQPMPTADGHFIAPTGKSFVLPMTTIGHWKGKTMDEEFLFWDNAYYNRQLGIAP